jgi:hypothetical protein
MLEHQQAESEITNTVRKDPQVRSVIEVITTAVTVMTVYVRELNHGGRDIYTLRAVKVQAQSLG